MGNASQINRSRNSVRVERRSDLNESNLGEVYCISLIQSAFVSGIFMTSLQFRTTRCSMRETSETALLHVLCGKPARRRYCMHGCKDQFAPPPTTTVSCINSLHAYSYIQQSGRCVKTMNAKNTKKSLIHENADANITCDFGDGDISHFRSQLPHTRTHDHAASHIVSSIIVRWRFSIRNNCG